MSDEPTTIVDISRCTTLCAIHDIVEIMPDDPPKTSKRASPGRFVVVRTHIATGQYFLGKEFDEMREASLHLSKYRKKIGYLYEVIDDQGKWSTRIKLVDLSDDPTDTGSVT